MTIVQKPVLYTLEEDLDLGQYCHTDCLLCDRHVRVEFKEGHLVHDLGNGEFAHCMQDTHNSTRTVQ